MTQTYITLALFVLLLAMLPWGIKWLQGRGSGAGSATGASRVLSAAAVGPHQRVVTVEVGPAHERTWLVLGVTAQSISCLHTVGVADSTGAQAADVQAVAARQA